MSRQFDPGSFLVGIMAGMFITMCIVSLVETQEDPRMTMMRKYIQIERLQSEIVELAK